MVPKTREHAQMCNAKCIGRDLYGEMTYTKLREFIYRASERPKTSRFFRGLRLVPMRSLKKSEHERTRGRGRKKYKLGSRGPIFADFRPIIVFWALLLKIQSAITPSILGVRGSSLDSIKLSPIPFINMPEWA